MRITQTNKAEEATEIQDQRKCEKRKYSNKADGGGGKQIDTTDRFAKGMQGNTNQTQSFPIPRNALSPWNAARTTA